MRLMPIVYILAALSCRGCTVNPTTNRWDELGSVLIADRVVKDTLSFDILGQLSKGIICIDHDVDLKGKACAIPADITLYMKGGKIMNGVLIGNETKIKGKGLFFEKVTIKGTWNVPNITTSMFANLDYDNSLRDVVALASPNVKNTIVIGKGEYQVSAMKNNDVCIPLCSNTVLKLHGIVKLVPNDYKHYNIIKVQGENIKITGNGIVIGDKPSHTGTLGEWGMGIRFHKAVNASVSCLTIKDCWGDCIYVGGNSKNVIIEKCSIDNGRRQGISVTSADSVTIKKCLITNVGGTKPEFAIDVEPNRGDTVDHIYIEEVVVRDCQGGFKATKSMDIVDGKPVSKIGSVRIRNCQVYAKRKFPILFKGCERASIEGCVISGTNARPIIYALEGGHVDVYNNIVKPNATFLTSTKKTIKRISRGKDIDPITIVEVKTHNIKDNMIVEQ